MSVEMQALVATTPRTDVGFEHTLHPLFHSQYIPDDAGTHLDLAKFSAGSHGGDSIGEFHFADRLHFFQSRSAIHRAAIEEHRSDDAVPGTRVCQKLVEKIADPSI